MQSEPICDLSIVIVSWNVWPQLRQCLASIERATLPGEGNVRWAEIRRLGDWEIGRLGDQETASRQSPISNLSISQSLNLQSPTLEVIVLDNASHDDTPAQIAAHFPWVRVIASNQNLGFTGGNNRGFAASRGRFVYFLNPDTELGGGAGDLTRHPSLVTGEGERGREGEGAYLPADDAQSSISNLPISQSPNRLLSSTPPSPPTPPSA